MPLEFLRSEKGKEKLLDNGHLYIKDKSTTEKVFWKCEKARNLKCHARVHTRNDEVILRIGEHNHAGDAASVGAARVMSEIKARASNSHDGAHRIMAEVSIGLNAAVAAHLPQPSSMKRTIRRVRNVAGVAPPNPQSRSELQLPPEYTVTENNEPFLLFDSGENLGRILIFSTRTNLRMLAMSDHWYADGTFKTVPLIFEQLYTIHGIRGHNVLPAVFALLPNKDEVTYRRLFSQLKQLEPGLAPQSIMTDFERPAINATDEEFPRVEHRGCFFHFNQCVWRKIQFFRLGHQYETDVAFALQMRMLPALAFVPRQDVVQAFEELIETIPYPGEAMPVVDYFEDTWIGRPDRRNGRRPPLYAHSLWNVYDAVVDGLPKTNNACEGWHRSFMELTQGHHSTIWKFLKALKLEQSKNEMVIEQLIAGQEPPPGKKKYRDCAARIQRIVNQYGQIDTIDYLRGLAHNFNF